MPQLLLLLAELARQRRAPTASRLLTVPVGTPSCLAVSSTDSCTT
jgi:hypothetical protein